MLERARAPAQLSLLSHNRTYAASVFAVHVTYVHSASCPELRAAGSRTLVDAFASTTRTATLARADLLIQHCPSVHIFLVASPPLPVDMSASPTPSADVVLFALTGASLFSICGSEVDNIAVGSLRIVSTSIKAEPVVQLLVGDTFRYTLFHQPTLRSVGRAYVLVAGASEHYVLKLDDSVAAEEVEAFERVLATASVLHDGARHVLVPNDHHGVNATSVAGMTSGTAAGAGASSGAPTSEPPLPPSRSVSTPTPMAATAAASAVGEGSMSPASAVAAVMQPSMPAIAAPGGASPTQTLSSGVATTTVALASPVPAAESPTTVVASYLTSGIAMGGRLLAAGAVAGAHVAGAGVK